MCGIIGCVGTPKNNLFTHTLLTNLLKETQRRGPHSTGHFGVNALDNVTFHFKSPIPAKIYVQLTEWTLLKNVNSKALIGHARYKTKGGEYNNLIFLVQEILPSFITAPSTNMKSTREIILFVENLIRKCFCK